MMYVMISLCIVKIYQFRHTDIATNAYYVMYGIAALLLMQAISLYTYGTVAKICFYFVFAVLYFCVIVYLMIDVYYYGVASVCPKVMLPISG